jgi:hypothetical protein
MVERKDLGGEYRDTDSDSLYGHTLGYESSEEGRR